MIGYLYILKSDRGVYYVGSTINITRRIRQHLSGNTQTTRNFKSFTVALVQEYDSLQTARKIERRIKKIKRKDYISAIIKDGFIKISP